ncbi:MAG: DUF4097 family beta strand repeat protein [Acidobacteria bacterium]|nr:DUF4097 family beta strand repeat protein [Acidobacteriota bacterium]
MRLVIALVAAAALLHAAEIEDRLTKSAPAKAGGRLTLDAEYGSVEVMPGAANAVEVEVYRKVDAPDRSRSERILRDFDLQVSEAAGEVTVRGIFTEGWKARGDLGRGDQRLCRDDKCLEYARYLKAHHYKVRVPTQFNVNLTTHGGSIEVGDLEGEARAKTSGGSLKFGRIAGPVWGRTSGGGITLSGTKGPADVRTSGGSIRIGDVSGSVEAQTSGGSVHIERATGKVMARTSGGSVTARLTAQPAADCSLTTSGGNVTVFVAESIKADLDASTSGGRVVTDIPTLAPREISRRSVKAQLNGGGPRLYLRTSGGSIHVRRAGGGTASL